MVNKRARSVDRRRGQGRASSWEVEAAWQAATVALIWELEAAWEGGPPWIWLSDIATALGRRGEHALEACGCALESRGYRARPALVWVIGAMADPRADALLREVSADGDPAVAAAALGALELRGARVAPEAVSVDVVWEGSGRISPARGTAQARLPSSERSAGSVVTEAT